jgi:alkylation response protein AidB-like acyl-CoA dehydrogenase
VDTLVLVVLEYKEQPGTDCKVVYTCLCSHYKTLHAARDYISMLKIVAPKMCEDVSSRAMQIFGGMGVSQDTPLAHIFTTSRVCRIADGPDGVHMSQLAKLTIRSLVR